MKEIIGEDEDRDSESDDIFDWNLEKSLVK